MMTAAEVAVSAPCAHACTASPRQVATSATHSTAAHGPACAARRTDPPAPTRPCRRPAATTTDTVVTPTAFVGVAHALSEVMCPANPAAPARVSNAPVVKDAPARSSAAPAPPR